MTDEEIYKLHYAGKTSTEISQMDGRSRSRVEQAIERHGLALDRGIKAVNIFDNAFNRIFCRKLS